MAIIDIEYQRGDCDEFAEGRDQIGTYEAVILKRHEPQLGITVVSVMRRDKVAYEGLYAHNELIASRRLKKAVEKELQKYADGEKG